MDSQFTLSNNVAEVMIKVQKFINMTNISQVLCTNTQCQGIYLQGTYLAHWKFRI